jgi:hypothetical protein
MDEGFYFDWADGISCGVSVGCLEGFIFGLVDGNLLGHEYG